MTNAIVTATRTYDHKDDGRIGKAGIRIMADGTVEMYHNDGDWQKLSVGSAEYMLNFSLQTFQDAYGGADKNKATRVKEFNDKVAKVLDGTIGTGGGGGKRTSAEDEAKLNLARTFLAKNKDATAKLNGKAADRDAVVAAFWDKNGKKLADQLAAEIAKVEARRKAEAEAEAERAKIAASLDVDVDI